jgi:hypothetical protein
MRDLVATPSRLGGLRAHRELTGRDEHELELGTRLNVHRWSFSARQEKQEQHGQLSDHSHHINVDPD